MKNFSNGNHANNGNEPGVAAEPNLFVSVIICTYGRATALVDLLEALNAQRYRKFEILVIDGNDEPSPAREAVEEYLSRPGAETKVEIVQSEKGLTRQRNVALQIARGDLLCFFDDDVTFEKDFLQKVAELFSQPHLQDLGGMTPYDTEHYPTPMTWRWKMRAMLNVMPGSDPGAADHLGRAVPLSFLKPWPGRKEIGWMPGFCMIYRRSATDGIWFDEMLPTYGGEDRDFSVQVGLKHRLLICGDIRLKHHYTVEGRDDGLIRLRQSSYGVGRRFAKMARGFGDYVTVAQTFMGDLLIDLSVAILRPLPKHFSAIFVRISGFVEGLRSVRPADSKPRPAVKRTTMEKQSETFSGTR
jgi:glycosyltransferase involved in cell wall biosynthesis